MGQAEESRTRRARIGPTAAVLALGAGALVLLGVPDVITRALSSDGFMPHGHCYLWRPELVWLHAVSDALISLAYLSIPVTLVVLVRRRRDLPFMWLFLLFGAFVLACGATHAMDVWTLWTPTYWVAGGLKAATAVISVASAATLARALPRVLALPDRLKELAALNAQLQISEARFRYVIEAAPTGMVIVDDAGVIVMVNKSLELLFDYAACEMLGRPVEMLVPPHLRAIHPRHRAGFLDDPRARAMGVGRELSGLRKDGSEIPIELGLTPLFEGGARRILGTVLDLSARRNAERDRKETFEALQSFQLMVDRVQDYAIFQLDAAGTIQTWNSGASSICGYGAEEVIGKNICIFYPADRAARPAEELGIAAAQGRSEEDGWRVRKDGSRFWANAVVTAVPGKTPGSVRGFVMITRDLTERKREEDARADALRERTALLQEVHHRVKNNLQMIASLLNLQARQVTDETLRGIFLETRGRVRSIALLHESLYQSADLGKVDMPEYVSKLVRALQQTYPADGAAARIVHEVDPISFAIDAAVPCGLIIHELLMNALKHAFAGRPAAPSDAIRVRLTEASGSVTLTVDDNGRGFAAAPDPDDETTLVLTLVRDLTSQLGGTVIFRTNSGASCTIEFPSATKASAS